MISPVFLQIGNFSIRWYGVCTALGLLLGYAVQLWRAKRYSFSKEMVADFTFYCMLGAVVGARLAYVIRFWNQEFAGQGLLRIFMIWEGGLVFQGGFILAALVGMGLVWYRKWNMAGTADLVAPALPAAHAIGRLGCLINGCCFGFHWEGPLAIHYPAMENSVLYIQKQQGVVAAEATECAGTFPIAGAESLGNLILCLVLLFLEKKQLCRGRLFLVYLLAYSVLRFVLEFARGDYLERIHGMTNAQITCIWTFAVGLFLWLFLHFRRKCKGKTAC